MAHSLGLARVEPSWLMAPPAAEPLEAQHRDAAVGLWCCSLLSRGTPPSNSVCESRNDH